MTKPGKMVRRAAVAGSAAILDCRRHHCAHGSIIAAIYRCGFVSMDPTAQPGLAAGEHSKDEEGLLQGLQEAHDHEGHAVQDWQGLSVRTG